MFEWLENRIDPFAPFDERRRRPQSVRGFAWHYLRPVRLARAALLRLPGGRALRDPRSTCSSAGSSTCWRGRRPTGSCAEHGTQLLAGRGASSSFVRPLLHFAHEIITNQILVPQTTNMIRWRTHLYTLGHALGYFQADFAGRLANRITPGRPGDPRDRGDAPRHAPVRGDLRLHGARPVLARSAPGSRCRWRLWIVAYVALLRYFVPRAQTRSLRGRRYPLGSRRPHRRQLHQHPDRQALRPRRGGALGGARRAGGPHAGLPRFVPADHRGRRRADGDEQRSCSWRPAALSLLLWMRRA